jgi:hypothetical protein
MRSIAELQRTDRLLQPALGVVRIVDLAVAVAVILTSRTVSFDRWAARPTGARHGTTSDQRLVRSETWRIKSDRAAPFDVVGHCTIPTGATTMMLRPATAGRFEYQRMPGGLEGTFILTRPG